MGSELENRYRRATALLKAPRDELSEATQPVPCSVRRDAGALLGCVAAQAARGVRSSRSACAITELRPTGPGKG